MPAVSKAQEHLFAMAKAVRKGALSKKEAGKKATELADSDISTKDLTDFARTKTKHLPKHVQKEEKMIQLTKEQYTKLIEETKRKAINEAYDDAVDKEEVQNIVDNFKPVADKIEHNEASSYFGVRLSDESGNSDLKFWMDVSINTEYNDVDIDWNQYIFNLTNSNDLLRRAIQNDADMFDKCSGEAVYALEKAGKIYQDDDASWHVGNGQTGEPVKEDVNRGYLTGGGTPKAEPNQEELDAVRKAYADMKAKGMVPAFIAYQLPDKFEACANYATAAEYKKQGYKIAKC